MKIGDDVFIHGYVNEIRKDIVIIENKGGYFGTVAEEIYEQGHDDEQRTGHWIKTIGENGITSAVRCSKCGFEDNRYMLFRYCPNCGAKMVEPQESEDKDCKEIVSFIMKEKYKRRNEKLVVLINKDIERKVKNLIVKWKENYPCLISHNRTLCGLPIVVMEVDDVNVVTFDKYKEMAESENKE